MPRFHTASRPRARHACAALSAILGGLLLVVLPPGRPSTADEPLFAQDPYDIVRLTEEAGGAELKVVPLDLPSRRVPADPDPDEALRLRLFSGPEKQYDVLWRHIEEVKLFEQFALEKAEALVAEGKFIEAYGYFAYLLENDREMPGLASAVERFLMKNAQASFKAGRADAALAMLLTLLEKNPERDDVSRAVAHVADRLITTRVRERDYPAARGLLDVVRSAAPEDAIVAKWGKALAQQAAKNVAAARAHLAAKRYREAREAGQLALALWPTVAGGAETMAEVRTRWPMVMVGVTTWPAPGGTFLDDWATRRRSRLVRRPLAELVGVTAEGGRYTSPVGQVERDSSGQRLTIRLRPGIEWGTTELTGYDVSRALLDAADPASALYRPDWSELLAGVSVRDVYEVVVDLNRPHPQPAALLQVPVDADRGPAIGPFELDSEKGDETRFLAHARYAGPEQPEEIVERRFTDSAALLSALKRGDVTVIDRVSPWDVAGLSRRADIVVDRYALTTVHVLLPNRQRPAPSNRALRRAIVYGIQRKLILEQELLAGRPAKGSVVLSGPFPVRTSIDDPLGYASDDGIEPREYDPRLAMTLATVAARALKSADEAGDAAAAGAGAEDGKAEAADVALPRLRLVHPDEPIAVAACAAIRRHLGLIGVEVELVSQSAQAAADDADDYDFRYASLAMWEPVVDARRLLGEAGPTGGASPYMDLALRRLDAAETWNAIRARLHEVHRIAHDDVAVIPLWQLVEHVAYHRRLEGVGERPALLYQQVEDWKIATGAP